MIDVAAAVHAYLIAQPEVASCFPGAIFTELAPTTSEPPFVVVRPFGFDELFPDVDTWMAATVLVDVVGAEGGNAWLYGAVDELHKALHDMRGAVVNGVLFQAVGPLSSAFSMDPSVTPVLPRWVLTVPVTVRSTAPQKESVA